VPSIKRPETNSLTSNTNQKEELAHQRSDSRKEFQHQETKREKKNKKRRKKLSQKHPHLGSGSGFQDLVLKTALQRNHSRFALVLFQELCIF
jgi:hypothetical protein